MPRTWNRRRPRAARLQYRSHAASSRRDRHEGHPGAHAILILDQAGWHGAKDLQVPSNISLLPLPPRSPELNSQENIWQFMRNNRLSNRIFKSFDDIVDHCCYAWNTLIDQPWKIMSIARRDWAVVGHSL
jgi:transposase